MKIRKLGRMPYARAEIHEYRVDYGDNGNYDVMVSYKTQLFKYCMIVTL